jgi:hypothetical protein
MPATSRGVEQRQNGEIDGGTWCSPRSDSA